MIEGNLIYSLLFFLIILQTIAGVGILVVGTPLLLIFNINIVSILAILLPISILTSFLNLIFFTINKKNLKIEIEKKTKKIFFIICLPSIILGLLILKEFQDAINFKYLVSLVIFFSIAVINSKKYLENINNKIRVIFLSLIGTIHGLTNSGGALLSLFLLYFNNKNQSRYNTTFYYFFLAFFQFLMFLIIFEQKIYFDNFRFILIFIPLGVIIGNYIIKYVNEKTYKNIVNILSLFTCLILLISN
jgi:uncharacterized membrane protein YfcA|tara:strand:- start:231 stop:968 length:738 start_codon:yes stop_codon:yes gene_type:complete